MTPIKADLCKLYLREYGSTAGTKLIGCTTGDSISFADEMLETTGLTSAYVELVPTYKSGQISSDTVLIMTESGDPQHATTQLIEWQKASQKLEFDFEWTEGVATKSITGAAYITSLSINAPAQDFASVQIALNITGEWQLDF